MKFFSALALVGSLLTGAAPVAQAQHSASPYHTRFAVDGPIILGLGATSAFGLYRVQQKSGLSDAELAALNKNDIPKIDRFSAGWYSDRAQTASDLLCYPTLVIAPALLALNDNVRGHYGQVVGLYIETMLATDALFTTSVGNIYRYRPYLYGTEGGGGRSGKIATNSFFAGHTGHTATATFFAAKVMHDFNPGYAGEPFVWGAAAVIPAAVAYFRIEAGKHFLTDNLVGYAVGATMGVVVPQLHKVAGRRGLSLMPLQGLNANGYAYSGMLLSKRL
ncbi:phosphatase PAP2 family protein [Hymenobacter siberiensis]|jgi:membrane-associated phospholipid phosphatase|uniref:phosphatase PAP2 family protein n=1 Tax=Hymenobacter siberiensis TaxID=2848396 RepID=UPI001C1E35CB|nr:phosphatase PAP2 family protein [Hymenobacter siberiensis]MBU6122168.1 phosphatase PAP2 family protein [Hymenobacter siberiensis]